MKASMMKTTNALRRAAQAARSRLSDATLAWGVGALALLGSSAARAVNDLPGGPAVNQIDLHPPVTRIAAEQLWLHNFMLVICTVIFVGVFGVMFYSIVKHRRSKGAKPANFHESTTVEIAWTVVPFLIVIAMALPATKAVVAMKDTTNADLTIKATGYQWKWGYDYVKGEGEGIAFVSTLDAAQRAMSDAGRPEGDNYLLKVDNPLVVPVDAKVRLLVTANDVIHAWWVPAFGVKQDAIPGFVRDTWFRADRVGIYRGQCAELCGRAHAYMPVVVEVKTKEDYAKWVGEQKQKLNAAANDPNKVWDLAALVAHGEQVYNNNCAACHQANGGGNTALGAPALAGDKVVLGPKQHQIDVVLNGQTNGVVQTAPGGGKMPAWKQLPDVDVAAVISYTRNSWGNKASENIVQPTEVKAERK